MAQEPSAVPDQVDPVSMNDEGIIDQLDTSPESININEATEQFAEAISMNLGVDIEPIADGELHRFADPKKRNSNTNCWYTLDPSGSYGVYGDWATGEPWTYWYIDDLTALSDEEIAEIQAKIETARSQRAQDRVKGHDKTAIKATHYVATSKKKTYYQRGIQKITAARNRAWASLKQAGREAIGKLVKWCLLPLVIAACFAMVDVAPAELPADYYSIEDAVHVKR
jgi:hypothetical protein